MGDDIRTLLRLLERMNCDGIARVREVALLYDQLNVTSLASFEFLCWRARLIVGAHSHGAQHPQYTGSEFDTDGLDTDAMDPILQKKVWRR